MQEALRFLSPGAEPVERADFVERARLLGRSPEAQARGLSLTIRGLRKSFGDNEVLRGIDLHIPAGQSVAIVGRSGCGKSTLLRLIAGLETATAGTISLSEDARPEDVRVMFQEPRLEHFSILRNRKGFPCAANRDSWWAGNGGQPVWPSRSRRIFVFALFGLLKLRG
jgi:hypothetical protein